MLRRAIADTPAFELSTIEIDRPGPHYTIDTLDMLQERHPSARLLLLIGGDSLRDLPGWSRPQEIVAAVQAFGVMRRPGDSIELDSLERVLPGIRAKVRFVEAPQLEIASSTIRQRIATGGHYRFYLPVSVYDYIQQNNLYR
jgi:nicotinate-nucleotide adenylyltransferase